MKKGTLLVCFGALAVALLVLAGCGGSDDSDSLTKDEFVAQGNAICKKGTEERNRIFKEEQARAENKPNQTFSDADREQLVRDVIVPPYEKTTKELKELGTPDEGAADVEAIVEAREKAIQKVDANPAPAVESTVQFVEANKLSAAYGLTDCVV
ncbi:MAG TPA: hypothetical protein VFY75_08790 [Solirubrobacterales bacterium]|nr:hypothetical protein [Solirubrobacterales bacterium]